MNSSKTRPLIVSIIIVLLLSSCKAQPTPTTPQTDQNMDTQTSSTPENESPVPAPTVTEFEHNGEPNHLINEKSPYLLQHAYNPIDWYPWGEEAFEKARAENKPIFLSIGYSTCHWCHVMEKESYNDEEVGRLMNETFIAIKVDREERPDIDSIYMDVAMMLNGRGGWPLNIIMTPDGEPFFAITYIPKETRFGQKGLLELIPQVQNIWLNERDSILKLADQVTASLQAAEDNTSGPTLGLDMLDSAYGQLAGQFDLLHGGFGEAPKFPAPHNLLFLLRQWQRTGDEQALAMVETTLQAMRQGGIYDHIGFGFHRYSTDAEWLVPHFEKMLYDQAMLAMTYTEAYLVTKDPLYEQTAREIFSYILRDMTSRQGGFYTAEDADSEGEEGKFYFWRETEIREILSSRDVDFVRSEFNLTNEGNFMDEISAERTGNNILHLSQPLDDPAARWEPIRQTLFEIREERIHPYKDEKILTDWNGLMIAALAKASQAFDEQKYAAAAQDAAEFILANMQAENGRLLHRYRVGEAGIQATLDDYAFLIWGLIELYETTFDVRYLESAIRFQDQLSTHFWDDSGGFYMTADDGETLLTRPKKVYDGAIPSGNSIAMLNLLRLSRMTANIEYEKYADVLGKAFAGLVQRAPVGYTQLLSAVGYGIGNSFEIVIVGEPGAADTEAMLTALRQVYLPNKVILLRPPGDDAAIIQLAEFTRSHYSIDGRATAYVCIKTYCKRPTTDVEDMLSLLSESKSGQ
ncbi:MAG: thioredoxin domain-containing protein [Anaerolineaceae bacterium]|nr:thioredoxin domain-containing protein [Anaerolineaceae bacterium]